MTKTTKKPQITVRIKLNKNGKRIAHYWGMARRWLPISLAEAEMLIATGQAWDYDED